MPISETKDIPLDKLRFIPGAPPGVCAARIRLKPGSSKMCEECPNPITEADGEVWFCAAELLRKRRKEELCYWHHDCLKPAPPSVAFVQ